MNSFDPSQDTSSRASNFTEHRACRPCEQQQTVIARMRQRVDALYEQFHGKPPRFLSLRILLLALQLTRNRGKTNCRPYVVSRHTSFSLIGNNIGNIKSITTEIRKQKKVRTLSRGRENLVAISQMAEDA